MKKNNLEHYNELHMILHWLTALLIGGNYILGQTLSFTEMYGFHIQLGMLIGVLVLFRIFWAHISDQPKELKFNSFFEKLATKIGQGILYLLMILVPLFGILLVQSHGNELHILGLIPLPSLISPSVENNHMIKEIHEFLANSLMFFAFLHALIALFHHYIKKDGLLYRMLPILKEFEKNEK